MERRFCKFFSNIFQTKERRSPFYQQSAHHHTSPKFPNLHSQYASQYMRKNIKKSHKYQKRSTKISAKQYIYFSVLSQVFWYMTKSLQTGVFLPKITMFLRGMVGWHFMLDKVTDLEVEMTHMDVISRWNNWGRGMRRSGISSLPWDLPICAAYTWFNCIRGSLLAV